MFINRISWNRIYSGRNGLQYTSNEIIASNIFAMQKVLFATGLPPPLLHSLYKCIIHIQRRVWPNSYMRKFPLLPPSPILRPSYITTLKARLARTKWWILVVGKGGLGLEGRFKRGNEERGGREEWGRDGRR